MTPEDKIADVTYQLQIIEAIKHNTKEVSDSLHFIRLMLALIIGLLASIAFPLRGATIFLPDVQPPLFDIDDPSKPPANPNLQHWYTMDVPGVNGVLPVEVFAPRLYSPVASVGPVDIDVAVPEPGTFTYALLGLVLVAGAAKCVMICKLYRLRCKIYDQQDAGSLRALAAHNAIVDRCAGGVNETDRG